ncbi:MAG: RDD family protein [Candidatus Anstonellales archaeon]
MTLLSVNTAKVEERFLAFAIDYLIVVIIVFSLVLVTNLLETFEKGHNLSIKNISTISESQFLYATIISFFFYTLSLESVFNLTLGKKIMGLELYYYELNTLKKFENSFIRAVIKSLVIFITFSLPLPLIVLLFFCLFVVYKFLKFKLKYKYKFYNPELILIHDYITHSNVKKEHQALIKI